MTFGPFTYDALVRRCELPRLEARLLLAQASGQRREWLVAHGDTLAPDDVVERFEHLCAQREAGRPIAYLLGWREFHGRRFDVDAAVLIPRHETEVLVELALALGPAGATMPATAAVLELGTGSGCIAVTLAAERPPWRLVATDGSGAALDVARRNARAHAVDARIAFRRSDGGDDWWSPIGTDERFALIVSNPPYVAHDDPHLRDGDLRFEPRTALTDASLDGLSSIRRIAAGAIAHLQTDGWLLLEHGADQGPAVRRLLREAGLSDVSTRLDLAERDRVTLGRRAG